MFSFLLSPSEQWIFRHTGMNVTLTFLVPTSTTSLWLKRFNNEKYISYCRDGQPARPSDQEESFRGRVEGMDCNRINGNVSVIVRNLTCNDSGTYELHGVDRDERRFNKTVFLIVTDPGETGLVTTLPALGIWVYHQIPRLISYQVDLQLNFILLVPKYTFINKGVMRCV